MAEALWNRLGAHSLSGPSGPDRRFEYVELARVGRCPNSFAGTPKFLPSTSVGMCLNQSLSRNVPSSSKSPSSNTRRNSHPSGPRPWIECGIPPGKYQRSPTPTSSTKLRPCGVDRRDAGRSVEHVSPFRLLVPVKLANAAGIEPHFTPAIAFETPSSRAVTWRVQPPLDCRTCASAKENLQIGQGCRIGRGRIEDVWVLSLAGHVAGTGSVPPTPGARLARKLLGSVGGGCAEKRACAHSCASQKIASGCGVHHFPRLDWSRGVSQDTALPE